MNSPKYERLSTGRDQEFVNGGDEIEMENDSKVTIIPPMKRPSHRSSKLIHMAIGTLGMILLYLTLSICLTFYQRSLLMDLKFPLTIVLYHLIIKLLLSTIVRTIYRLTTGKLRVQVDCRNSLRKMAPTGFASGIDIGFSNCGLELVNISLYTMTKSSTIIFILFFAIILGLEKKSWSLVGIVVMIGGGLFMFTYKSTQFNAFGFALLLFASFASGIRWSFAQLIMQKSKLGLHNPVDMIYHMQPWMILSILPFTIGFEGARVFDAFSKISEVSNEEIAMLVIKVSTGAAIAFIMEVSEFLVLSYTSSLTLSIAGIFKDICQLVLAVELNGDELSVFNVMGLILCLGGIFCHIIHKYSVLTTPKTEGNDDTSTFLDDIENAVNGGGGISNDNIKFRKNAGGQNVPLLDSNDLNNSDSDDSQNDIDNRNASDVIFDVLKRRDSTKR